MSVTIGRYIFHKTVVMICRKNICHVGVRELIRVTYS